MRGEVPVFTEPAKNGKPKLIIVGEGPGRKEIIQGKVFVGPTGQLLNQVLREAGIRRDECHLSNATLCARPDDEKANLKAATFCAPRLLQEAIDHDAPILALGKAATKSLLGVSSIQLARGFVWTMPEVSESKVKAAKKDPAKQKLLQLKAQLAGRTVFPTNHPAFVLRSDAWRPILQLDVNRVGRWLRGELDESTLDNHLDGAWESLEDPILIRAALESMGGVLACDIETTVTGSVLTADIVCVGVSDGTRTIVIDPWVPAAHSGLLSDAFRTRVVVGHNFLGFDQLALERDGVVFEGVVEDTMVAHHAYASHFPQKLDQCVSEYCSATPWKIVYGRRGGTVASEKGGLPPHKMPREERDMYCAMDCVLTYLSWVRMQPDLDKERGVYERDKQVVGLCQRMQVGGIGVDALRRSELSAELKSRRAEFKSKMAAALSWPDFDPLKLSNVQKTLFGTLGARVLQRTETGQPSTAEAVLEEYAKQDGPVGDFARDLMGYRLVVKTDSTYLEAVPVLADGRAHYSWKLTTVSGRMNSRFQSNPRLGPLPEQRVREVYVATGKLRTAQLVAQVHDAAIFEVGGDLIYFDLCFAEGTGIDTPTGVRPIESLQVGDLVYTWRDGKPAVGKVTQHFSPGRARVVKVTLDNGETVRCTPDHKWLVLPWGSGGVPVEREADSLRPGDRLLALRKQIHQGREHLYSYSAFQYSKTHIEVAKAAYGIRPSPKHHVHHKDDNPLNNDPTNLEYKEGSEHASDHGKVLAKRQWADPTVRKKMVAGLKRAAKRDPTWCKGEKNPRYNPDQKCFYCGAHKKYSTAKYCSRKCYADARRNGLNHKVVSVMPDGEAPVWSIAVDPDHNYALSAGVFVKNCQAEARLAAYLSGDPALIEAVETDIHTANARLLFGSKPGAEDGRFDKPKLKNLLWEEGGFRKERDVTKNAGFCVWYVGAADKVFSTLTSKGFPVTMRHCEIFFNRCHDKYYHYYEYVNRNLDMVRRQGFMRTAGLGRFRWLGFFPSVNDVANYPIQAGIADVMNERLVEIEEKARRMTSADDVEALIRDIWARPVTLRKGPIVSEDREFVLPADIKRGRSWASLE